MNLAPFYIRGNEESGLTEIISLMCFLTNWGFPGGSDRPQRICLQCRRPGFDPWVWKIPCRRECLPSPVFLPGEFDR